MAEYDEIIETAVRSSLDALAAAPDDIAAKTRAAVTAILNSVIEDPRRARIAFAEAHGSEILMRRRAAAPPRCAPSPTWSPNRNAHC